MTRITVGVPLYNNARTLKRAITSIQNQTHSDLEIILSDDGSNDNTWELCEELQRSDSRIKSFRQENNLYYNNFKFVLEKSTSPYFVWLAGDDYWEPTYLEQCLEILQSDPTIVGCVAKCRFTDDGKDFGLSTGTHSLTGTKEERIVSYFYDPSDNTRMYGLFRTHALSQSFPKKIVHAYDWAISVSTLTFGTHFEIDEILIHREKTLHENYVKLGLKDNKNIITKLFPILSMTINLIKNKKIPKSKKIIAALIRANYIKHVEVMKWKYPSTHNRLGLIYRTLDRALI